MPALTLRLLPYRLSICRLPGGAPLPENALSGPFFSLTRTADELSIVCPQEAVPADAACEHGWRAFMVQGPLDFSLTGVLSSLADPLAQAGIATFAISTYDTDYLLVKEATLLAATQALQAAGHRIINPPE